MVLSETRWLADLLRCLLYGIGTCHDPVRGGSKAIRTSHNFCFIIHRTLSQKEETLFLKHLCRCHISIYVEKIMIGRHLRRGCDGNVFDQLYSNGRWVFTKSRIQWIINFTFVVCMWLIIYKFTEIQFSGHI